LITAFEKQLVKLVGSSTKSRFLVAISGGMDSVVLAHMCQKLGLQFDLCHVNYHLRAADSDLDEAFVRDLAEAMKVRLFHTHADLSAFDGNIQMEARAQRYRFFEEIIKKEGHDYIMTAHHLDDLAETFLFNVGRGTGIDGALSIPAQNDRIIRPMIQMSRQEIADYAQEHQIAYREDVSNKSDKYARNYLRHHVIPELKKQNPNFLKGLQKTIAHLGASAHFSKLALDRIIAERLRNIGWYCQKKPLPITRFRKT